MSDASPQEPSALEDTQDVFGIEPAVAELAARLERLHLRRAGHTADGRPLLSPPFAPARDRVEGPFAAVRTIVAFGAFATPGARELAAVFDEVRAHHLTTARIVWRHFPDPAAHPRALVFALAAEAAARSGKFWLLARHLLELRDHGPAELHEAVLRAGMEPRRTLELMRVGVGGDMIVADTESALASGVLYSPALFIDGIGYSGELDPAAVSAAVA